MEQKQETKTEMTNPPSNSTNMTQDKKPQGKAKLVKLKAIAVFAHDGKQYQPGDVLEVDQETAKQLTRKIKRGYFAFSGERGGDDAQLRHGHNKCEIWRAPVKEDSEELE